MILFIIFICYIIFSWENLNPYIIIIWILFFGLFAISVYLYEKKSFKLHNKKTPKKILKMEIKNTIYSFFIYFFIIFWFFYLFQKWIIWFDFSFNFWLIPYTLILILFHDVYFYFVHKLLHTKYFYKNFHLDHHRSVYPTLWSAYNFHPVEAILYVFVALPIFFINLNFFALLFTIFINDFLVLLWHSGYELFEKKPRNWFFKYFIIVSFHDSHHTRNKWNLWLYFSWWDKLFKTYDEEWELNIKK